MVAELIKKAQKPENKRVGILKPCQGWAGMLMVLILKVSSRKTARYKPSVLMTILIVPRVMMFMGNRRSFITGLMISSKSLKVSIK